MTKVPVSPDKFETQLKEQLTFLEDSARAFDAGKEPEFKRMATTLRVLFHDTPKSTSLLKHLNKIDALSLNDTAVPIEPKNATADWGLIWILDEPPAPRFVPIFDVNTPLKMTHFQQWWNNPVIMDVQRRSISRKDLILTAANKDGGAHVDGHIDEKYFDVFHNNSMNVSFAPSHAPNDWKPVQGAVPAAVRQIAHEALSTLKVDYDFSPPDFTGKYFPPIIAIPEPLPGLGGPPYKPKK